MEGWISFHPWGDDLFINWNPQVLCPQTCFQKVNFHTVVYLASSHRGRMDLISLMGGRPLYKRESQSLMTAKSLFKKQIAYAGVLSVGSRREKGFCFIHGMTNPL